MLILGDVRVDAERNRLDYRAEVERAGIARLEAEHLLAGSVRFPPTLLAAAKRDARVREALAKEQSLFRARHYALACETALINTQRGRI